MSKPEVSEKDIYVNSRKAEIDAMSHAEKVAMFGTFAASFTSEKLASLEYQAKRDERETAKAAKYAQDRTAVAEIVARGIAAIEAEIREKGLFIRPIVKVVASIHREHVAENSTREVSRGKVVYGTVKNVPLTVLFDVSYSGDSE